MLKILQVRLQQYVKHELPYVQAVFRKDRGTRDQIANSFWIIERAREFQKNNTLATWCKELTYWNRPWCWERLRAGGEEGDRGWDGWMASPTQWTRVWVNSKSWDGQGGLVCWSPWGRKKLDTTEQLNWTEPLSLGMKREESSLQWCVSWACSGSVPASTLSQKALGSSVWRCSSHHN